MFAYGVCVGNSGKFEQVLLPSLWRTAPSGPIIARRGWSSIHAAYNSILSEASSMAHLEGLVLLHDDVEVRDLALEDKLRGVLDTDCLRVVGTVGGRRVNGLSCPFGGEGVVAFPRNRLLRGVFLAA